ncbi:hypothetical protein EG850_12800 [Gulosibacter macacae]|uniref:Uncharacterized protein n=1 Tax=Gulosibacter macacae TaxID=2488791 RepID=A0A3P3VS28_9MICO|nr:hypothetical protein [Gulosibacter macacae]RRJ85592.1 hypothetical protein EG850_12800 [Gulosibacter macacae]
MDADANDDVTFGADAADSGAPTLSWQQRVRNEVNWAMIALAIATLVVSVLSVFRVLEDPYASDLLSFSGFLAFAIFGFWCVAELVLMKNLDEFVPRAVWRTFVPGPVLTVVALAVHAALTWSAASASAERFPEVHGSSATETYTATLGLTFLINVAMPMMGALLALVFVVVPVFAFRRSDQFVAFTGRMQENEAAGAKNVSRAFAVMLMTIFAAPILWVFGEDEAKSSNLGDAFGNVVSLFADPQGISRFYGDLMWVLGVLSIPVGASIVLLLLFGLRRKPQADDEIK